MAPVATQVSTTILPPTLRLPIISMKENQLTKSIHGNPVRKVDNLCTFTLVNRCKLQFLLSKVRLIYEPSSLILKGGILSLPGLLRAVAMMKPANPHDNAVRM